MMDDVRDEDKDAIHKSHHHRYCIVSSVIVTRIPSSITPSLFHIVHLYSPFLVANILKNKEHK